MSNASTLLAVGSLLTLEVDRRFAFLPLVVGGFPFQHATQEWCPPLPILRRFGDSTQTEIDHERYALKTLHGDFERVPVGESVQARQAVRAAEG